MNITHQGAGTSTSASRTNARWHPYTPLMQDRASERVGSRYKKEFNENRMGQSRAEQLARPGACSRATVGRLRPPPLRCFVHHITFLTSDTAKSLERTNMPRRTAHSSLSMPPPVTYKATTAIILTWRVRLAQTTWASIGIPSTDSGVIILCPPRHLVFVSFH